MCLCVNIKSNQIKSNQTLFIRPGGQWAWWMDTWGMQMIWSCLQNQHRWYDHVYRISDFFYRSSWKHSTLLYPPSATNWTCHNMAAITWLASRRLALPAFSHHSWRSRGSCAGLRRADCWEERLQRLFSSCCRGSGGCVLRWRSPGVRQRGVRGGGAGPALFYLTLQGGAGAETDGLPPHTVSSKGKSSWTEQTGSQPLPLFCLYFVSFWRHLTRQLDGDTVWKQWVAVIKSIQSAE